MEITVFIIFGLKFINIFKLSLHAFVIYTAIEFQNNYAFN